MEFEYRSPLKTPAVATAVYNEETGEMILTEVNPPEQTEVTIEFGTPDHQELMDLMRL